MCLTCYFRCGWITFGFSSFFPIMLLVFSKQETCLPLPTVAYFKKPKTNKPIPMWWESVDYTTEFKELELRWNVRIGNDSVVLSDEFHQLLSLGSSWNYYYELFPFSQEQKEEKMLLKWQKKNEHCCVCIFILKKKNVSHNCDIRE